MLAAIRSWNGRTSDLVRPPIAQVNQLAAELSARGAEIIDLGQAVLGLPPPSAALQPVTEFLARDVPHPYSPDPGLPALREAIAAFCRSRKGVSGASQESVMVTCGANQAFADVLLTVTRPGDEVITFGPGYFDHDYVIGIGGCRQVVVSLPVRERRFCFDIEAVEGAISPRTRCVVLVSPGNPTGAVAGRGFVEDLVALCQKHDLWLISDEVYDLLTFPPSKHVSPASVGAYDKVVVLGSFSKCFGLAGWRVGYFLGSPELVEEAIKVQDAIVVCAAVPSQLAALGALQVVDEFVGMARRELERRRDALLEALGKWSAVTAYVPDGATFFLARIGEGGDDVEFCKQLLVRAGVVTVPGSAFGPDGAGHVRFSFGNQPVEMLARVGEKLLHNS